MSVQMGYRGGLTVVVIVMVTAQIHAKLAP